MLSESEIHNADPAPHVMSDQHRLDFAHAILAAYQAKLLAELEMPEAKHFYYADDDHRKIRKPLDLFTKDQLQQYAAAAAAQARVKALDEAMLAVNSGVLGHGECAAAIESLKGKQA